MRYAVPVSGGRLAEHFGHCEQFALFDVDETSKEITKSALVPSPGHQPGFLPQWLSEQGVSVIIAGGMGHRAQGLFAQNNIKVVTGASSKSPDLIVEEFLNGSLQTGDNLCDH